MLLISIHPFAFRRLALVVLAITGFSALCFADPVLMAHRYTHSSSTRMSVPAKPTADGVSASPWNSPALPETMDARRLTLSGLGARPCERRIDALDAMAPEGFFLMATD
jgi:hypothetical protein